MKKIRWLIFSFSIIILGVLFLCKINIITGQKLNHTETKVLTHLNFPFPVPDDTDVKSMTVYLSGLPVAKKATYTYTEDKSTVDQILTWLKNSKEIGPEKPTPGRDGYPPSLSITINNGTVLTIVPVKNWTVNKLSNGSTSISGVPATGYIAVRNYSSSTLLYSPDLYDWIFNARWDKTKNDTSTK